jgi:hypothetical protein
MNCALSSSCSVPVISLFAGFEMQSPSMLTRPVAVAERSTRLEAGNVGSNPTQGMDV